MLGISPYINYDRKWIGIGGGLHFGNISYVIENRGESGYGIPESGSKSTPVYPRLYVRIGQENIFFADYRFANHFPSALPGFRHQLGIGTGFGSESGVQARFGTTFLHYYLAGHYPVKNKFVLEPTLLWVPQDGIDYNYSVSTPFQFSLGLSYRFDYREEKK